MELKTYFAQDASGNIIPNAQVFVYLAGTTTLASGIVDQNGAPLTNPFNADSSAAVVFAAPDGEYDVKCSGASRTVTIRAQLFDGGAFKADLASTAAGKGAGLVGFKQSATGAVGRTVDDKLGEVVSVKDFGAVGDGVADDTDAVLNAIVAAQLGGKALHIPAGLYICDDRLLASVGKTLVINGDGADVSEIRWTNAAGGIQFDGGVIVQSRPVRFVMRDICLSTSASGGGSAVAVSYQGGVGTTSQLLSMDRVLIRGAGNNAYWTIGCDFDNVRNSQLSNVSVIGSITNQVAMSKAYRLGDSLSANPVDISLENCNGFFCDVAIEIGDNGVGNAEGVSIIGGRYILNNYGVRWNTLNNKPLLHVIGTHIASRVSCIYTRKNVQSMFSENLLYVRDETTSPFTAIDCDADASVAWDSVISNNVIRCNKTLAVDTDGVYVNGARGAISGNVIAEPDVGIELGATSASLIVSGNQIRLPGAAPYADNGANNVIVDFERGNLRTGTGGILPAYVEVLGGSSTAGPRIRSEGAAADIPIRISSKGAGIIQMLSGSLELMRVNPVASVVNYADIVPSATGSPVQYRARGTDTNIDLRLDPKGAGRVQFGTHTASADAPVTGYIEIKDSGGTVRRLAVIG